MPTTHELTARDRLKKRRAKLIEILFTLLGTAVLVVTFYIHEVKREKVRAFSEGVEGAEATGLIRRDISSLRDDIERLKNAIAGSGGPPIHTMQSDLIFMDRQLWDLDDYKRQQGIDLQVLIPLAESLERGPFYRERLNQIFRDGDELRTKIKKLRDDIGPVLRAAGSTGAENDVGLVARFNSLRNRSDYAAVLQRYQDECFSFSTDLTKEANERLQEAKMSNERYTKWSYYLYGLGFLLSLVGKLFGLGEISRE